MTSDASAAPDDSLGVGMSEGLAEECANWIAEQLTDTSSVGSSRRR